MELPSDDGNPQMELPRKRSKPGPKLRAQAAVKDKDFEIVGGDNKAGRENCKTRRLQTCNWMLKDTVQFNAMGEK